MRKFIILILMACLLSNCGALFYPERHGNTHDVDPRVAVFDGIGLLFFLVPGIVAYAIDFGTGCIYLSGHDKKLAVVPLDKVHTIDYQLDKVLSLNKTDTVVQMPMPSLSYWSTLQNL